MALFAVKACASAAVAISSRPATVSLAAASDARLASDTAAFSWAWVKLPSTAALPTEVTCPVRFALVVTLVALVAVAALPDILILQVPVALEPSELALVAIFGTSV